jgi:hypothetical protein
VVKGPIDFPAKLIAYCSGLQSQKNDYNDTVRIFQVADMDLSDVSIPMTKYIKEQLAQEQFADFDFFLFDGDFAYEI